MRLATTDGTTPRLLAASEKFPHRTTATKVCTWVVVMRFLTGIGLGAAMLNTTTLLAEYIPERRRSLLITIMFIGFGVGSAVVGFAAGWLIPHLGWRSVLIACGPDC